MIRVLVIWCDVICDLVWSVIYLIWCELECAPTMQTYKRCEIKVALPPLAGCYPPIDMNDILSTLHSLLDWVCRTFHLDEELDRSVSAAISFPSGLSFLQSLP